MRLLNLRTAFLSASAALAVAAPGRSADPQPVVRMPDMSRPAAGTKDVTAPRPPDPNIKLVRQPLPEPEPPRQPGAAAPPTTAPATPAPAAAPTGGGVVSPGGQQDVRPPAEAPGGGSTSTVGFAGGPGGGGAGGTTGPAADLGTALRQSENAAGVEVQQRNAISIDPRIRGLRNSQYLTTGDGAAFFPARLDLDTPVSKFDPGSVRDVRIIRGPYTSLLGPGLAFLDIATVDTPRNREGGGIKYGGRTSLGYQTNGEQWNGLQAVTAAGEAWGFRGTYNILQGNDYRDGDGNLIPASYKSNNFNYALGFDLTERSTLEFKGLRVQQTNLEFPGLFFDIRRIDTEAYTIRHVLRDVGALDQVTFDVWYNTTVGSGDTRNTSKQRFVSALLGEAFLETSPGLARVTQGAPVFAGQPGLYSPFRFVDESSTQFGERSLGYRLAGQWGNNRDEWTLFAGTDLNLFGQSLTENIRFAQLTDRPTDPVILGANGQRQTLITQDQSIPKSDLNDAGLFLESLLPVNRRLRVRSGGRVDFVRASSDPRLITGNFDLFGAAQNVAPAPRVVVDPGVFSVEPGRAVLGNNLTRDFVLYNGFATAEYLLTDTATLFLNYGYAERAPTITELYASGPFIGVLQQGTSRLIGDPNLAKERLNQLDVGLRYDYEWLQVRANAFYAWIHDYITFDANKLSSLPSGGLTQVVFTNTDLATLAGTELFVQMNATDWLTPFATLSYVQGIDQTHRDDRRPRNLASSRRNNPATREFATDTEPLPQIPPMEARAGFRLHEGVRDPRWQMEFEARMVTGQNEVARSLGELTTPGFTTFAIRGFVRPTKSWVMTAGVENLGDLLFREHLDPISSTILRANTGIPVAPLYRPGTNFFFTSQVTY